MNMTDDGYFDRNPGRFSERFGFNRLQEQMDHTTAAARAKSSR
jgi:hypothetical protein